MSRFHYNRGKIDFIPLLLVTRDICLVKIFTSTTIFKLLNFIMSFMSWLKFNRGDNAK